MESPVLVMKPDGGDNIYVQQKYNGKNPKGGFRLGAESPEGVEGDAWEQLAARHPQLLGLRQGGVWPRKRRGSAAGHERPHTDFPEDRSRNYRDLFFDYDIPAEFREHIPEGWGQRYEPAEAPGPSHTEQVPPPPPSDKATQTQPPPQAGLPQYGLRNTVDLGRRSTQEPEGARGARSMSAPPEHKPGPTPGPPEQPTHNNSNNTSNQPNVRHIPIFVEGRDEPVVNTSTGASASASASTTDGGATFAEARASAPADDQYFSSGFHQPPHFARAFGAPFKGFSARQSPFAPPQTKQTHAQTQSQPQPKQQQQQHQQQQQQHQQQQHQQQQAPPQPHPEPAHQPPPQNLNDPISKIQIIQKDVTDLMDAVENFTGQSKKDKQYIYLDEMLTRNLIKLDDIETEGKENIRLARREAIKCIQKLIAVLEIKAESNAAAAGQGRAIQDHSADPPLETASNTEEDTSKNRDKSKEMDVDQNTPAVPAETEMEVDTASENTATAV